MRGHEPLVAMRVQGLRPASVELHCGAVPAWFTDEWGFERHVTQPTHARVAIDDGETIPMLDLRFVVGLPVIVTGADPKRMRQAFDAAVEAGAKRVMSLIGYDYLDTEDQCS